MLVSQIEELMQCINEAILDIVVQNKKKSILFVIYFSLFVLFQIMDGIMVAQNKKNLFFDSNATDVVASKAGHSFATF